MGLTGNGMGLGGTRRVTADTDIGDGKPIRVLSVHWLSSGTAGTLVLRNGTTASDEIRYQKVGTINDGLTETFGESGIFFPAGLFYDHDANTTFAAINFVRTKSV